MLSSKTLTYSMREPAVPLNPLLHASNIPWQA